MSVGDPVGTGVGASVLGEFVETGVGAATGGAIVGGGTGGGFTTPVEEGVLLLLVKTTATTTATTFPTPTNSNSSHGPNHVLSEYHCLLIGDSAAAAASQGFRFFFHRDSLHKCNDRRFLAISTKYW